MWRNHATGARAVILPIGVDSAVEPDRAGIVPRGDQRPLDDVEITSEAVFIGGYESGGATQWTAVVA